jgi:hypothetical protein
MPSALAILVAPRPWDFISRTLAASIEERLPFERSAADVRDADMLNLDRHASAHAPGLGHYRCEPGEHKASEHLGREAVHYDEHFQADTARDVGQRLVEGTVRDSDASEIREA